jgi:hypothetical protein
MTHTLMVHECVSVISRALNEVGRDGLSRCLCSGSLRFLLRPIARYVMEVNVVLPAQCLRRLDDPYSMRNRCHKASNKYAILSVL